MRHMQMPLAVHHNTEFGKAAIVAIGIVIFVVVALTWVPEWVSPSGEKALEGSNVGATVRMLK